MTSSGAVMEDPAAWSEQAVPGRYRYDWQLFVDWCAATDRTALPADPGTVIAFLDAHPAARDTNRPRLTAIRWAHRHARELAPHRTAELRSRVLPDTSRRADVETIRPLLEEMPTSGWTAGLVGRRNALLLVLAAAGVPYAAMERLHRRDVVVDENRCLVVTLPTAVLRIPAGPGDPRTCPVAVYLRWARLLAHYDRYPSARALEKALRAAQPIGADTVERYQPLPDQSRDGRDPLLPTIDRWGQFGAPRGTHHESWGLAADSAARIVNAHLSGVAVPRYLAEKADWQGDIDGIDEDRVVARPLSTVYSDGAGLRRSDTQRLSDLEDRFDEIEQRAADLATWIASLIDSTVGDASPIDSGRLHALLPAGVTSGRGPLWI